MEALVVQFAPLTASFRPFVIFLMLVERRLTKLRPLAIGLNWRPIFSLLLKLAEPAPF
jgi:hypothetical protein